MANEVKRMLRDIIEEAAKHRPMDTAAPEVREAYCRGVYDMAQMMAAMAAKTEQEAAKSTDNVKIMAHYFARMIRDMLAVTNALIPDGYEP